MLFNETFDQFHENMPPMRHGIIFCFPAKVTTRQHKLRCTNTTPPFVLRERPEFPDFTEKGVAAVVRSSDDSRSWCFN